MGKEKKLTDVPSEEVAAIDLAFRAEGAVDVQKIQQEPHSAGLWTVIGIFPNGKSEE